MRVKEKLDIALVVAGALVFDLLPWKVVDRVAKWSLDSPSYQKFINR